mgnify:FL=1
MKRAEDRFVIALDASTAAGSVAVANRGKLLAEVTVNVASGHSSALLPAIDYVVEAAGAQRDALAAVVVGSGPGSFTGVRIAAATAKGIAGALSIPLMAYSSLLAAAAGAATGGGETLVLFDARGRDVYAACYRFGAAIENALGPSALTLDELLAHAATRQISTVTGDAVVRHRDEVERALGIPVSPPHLHAPRASALLWLAEQWPELGRVDSAAGWEPDYLRASGAERIAAARERAQVRA